MTSRIHEIPIVRADTLGEAANRDTGGMAVNIYRSANYIAIDAGLPRCRPENIRVTLAPDQLLIKAERHPGEAAAEDEREYLVRELPYGTLSRVIPLPSKVLALHRAEAHFENGLLSVTISTRERDAYLHRFRGVEAPQKDSVRPE